MKERPAAAVEGLSAAEPAADVIERVSQGTERVREVTEHVQKVTERFPKSTEHGHKSTECVAKVTERAPQVTEHLPQITDRAVEADERRPKTRDHLKNPSLPARLQQLAGKSIEARAEIVRPLRGVQPTPWDLRRCARSYRNLFEVQGVLVFAPPRTPPDALSLTNRGERGGGTHIPGATICAADVYFTHTGRPFRF